MLGTARRLAAGVPARSHARPAGTNGGGDDQMAQAR
jgi:hypothetical protein